MIVAADLRRAGTWRCSPASSSSATRSAAFSAPWLGGYLFDRTGTTTSSGGCRSALGHRGRALNLPIASAPDPSARSGVRLKPDHGPGADLSGQRRARAAANPPESGRSASVMMPSTPSRRARPRAPARRRVAQDPEAGVRARGHDGRPSAPCDARRAPRSRGAPAAAASPPQRVEEQPRGIAGAASRAAGQRLLGRTTTAAEAHRVAPEATPQSSATAGRSRVRAPGRLDLEVQPSRGCAAKRADGRQRRPGSPAYCADASRRRSICASSRQRARRPGRSVRRAFERRVVQQERHAVARASRRTRSSGSRARGRRASRSACSPGNPAGTAVRDQTGVGPVGERSCGHGQTILAPVPASNRKTVAGRGDRGGSWPTSGACRRGSRAITVASPWPMCTSESAPSCSTISTDRRRTRRPPRRAACARGGCRW